MASSSDVEAKTGVLTRIAHQFGVALASKAMLLSMVFVYAHMLPVGDYGVLSLYLSYLWIFGIAMTLNIHVSIGRYAYDKRGDFAEFLPTNVVVFSTIYAMASLFIVAFIDYFEGWLGLPGEVLLIALVVAYAAVVESVVTQVSIAENASGTLLRVMALKALCVFTLSIFLLTTRDDRKYLGVLQAELVCALGLILFFFVWLRSRTVWRFKVSHLRFMCAYSIPLIAYNLSLTLLSQFDRVQVDSTFGKYETGMYSLAANFGMLLNIVATILLNAVTLNFFGAMNALDSTRVVRESEAISAFMAFAALCVVLFGESLVGLIVPAEYHAALSLVPFVAVGAFCLSLFQVWSRVLAFHNKTYLISMIAVFGMALKLGLNHEFLESQGYSFAAVTTILGYGAMGLLAVTFARRMLGINSLRWLPSLGCITFLLAAVSLPVDLLPKWLDIIARLVILVSFLVMMRRPLGDLVWLVRKAEATGTGAA